MTAHFSYRFLIGIGLLVATAQLCGCASEEGPPPDTSGSGGAGGSSTGTGGSGGSNTPSSPPEGPSCSGLPKCAIGEKPTSCCETLYVPGGTFLMGRGAADACTPEMASCYERELPEHSVTVPPFFLDTFEVTVGRFRKFAEAYQGPPYSGSGAIVYAQGSGWKSVYESLLSDTEQTKQDMLTRGDWTGSDPPDDLRPAMITWLEAMMFCIWDGGRLPTEAEWEFAAAGGDENRLFPWGDATDSLSEAITVCTYPQDMCDPQTDSICAAASPCESINPRNLQVGAKPAGAGRWGHQNLADGWTEWVFDRYEMYDAADCANQDCVVLPNDNSGDRMRRGATSSLGGLGVYRVAYRWYAESAGVDRWGKASVRCARDNPKQ